MRGAGGRDGVTFTPSTSDNGISIGNADNIAINYYEVDTEHDMQEIDVANAPMGSRCYVVNTGSTYALNSSKEWKLVPTSGGETPSGGTDISLGLTAATVGQTVKVKAVDIEGKPTAWEAVEDLQPDVNQIKDDLSDLQTAKMDSYTIKTVMDSVATPHTQYYLGNQTAVDIVLPDSANVGQIIMVCWYNGDTAATLSITGTMLSFDYAPSANTRSEINALWDGTYWAVLGNEMAVPSEVTA